MNGSRQKASGTRFAVRSVMLDMGRVTERKEYYRSLLPWLAEWGYNTVHLHLADDQRCALEFPSHPELATAGAFTAEEMRQFVRAARRYGLEVMPEIECLGHSRFVTEHPRHRRLAEPGNAMSGFNSLCPSHPEVRRLLADLLRDAAGIFEHPLIHVGLDEVKLGRCPRCERKFGAKAGDSRRHIEHAAWVCGEVRRLGRRPAMWVDHAMNIEDLVAGIGTDAVMFSWNYTAEFPIGKVAKVVEAGFDVVCCPATVCWLTRAFPNALDVSNLRTAISRAAGLRSRRVLGVDNTVWCPWRYLPGGLDFGLAFGGHLMTMPAEDSRFPARFAREFYRLRGGDAEAVGAALTDLWKAAFNHNATTRIVFGPDPNGNSFSRDDVRMCAEVEGVFAGALRTLRRGCADVGSNRPRYDDLILTVECMLAVARFGAAGRKRVSVPGLGRLMKRALKAWERDRYPDDTNKFGDARHFGTDGLLAALREMARDTVSHSRAKSHHQAFVAGGPPTASPTASRSNSPARSRARRPRPR